MLTVDECRDILGLPDVPDEQVAEIRDTLYAFAGTFVDQYLRDCREQGSPPAQ